MRGIHIPLDNSLPFYVRVSVDFEKVIQIRCEMEWELLLAIYESMAIRSIKKSFMNQILGEHKNVRIRTPCLEYEIKSYK